MRFLQGHWTFLGPGSEKMWYGESSYPPNGELDSTANKMVQRFKETGHPVLNKNLTASQRFAYLEVNKRDIMMFSASGGLHPVSGCPKRKPFPASCQIWVLLLFFCGACLLGDTAVAQQCLVLVLVLASRGMRARI